MQDPKRCPVCGGSDCEWAFYQPDGPPDGPDDTERMRGPFFLVDDDGPDDTERGVSPLFVGA